MRCALITGAGQGIGRAIAERFLANGYQVVATDLKREGLEELRASSPDRVAIVVQDVTDDAAPQQAIDLAMSHYGRLDVLVNNAGFGRALPVGQTTDEQLDAFLDVHVRAPFRFCRAALGVMVAGGAMVNISSIFGFRGSPGGGAYTVAKSAVVGLTRQMAADCGPEGIRVNAVAPGIIRTALTEDRIEGNPRFRQLMVDTIPFPRVGTPEDVAAAVAFLASDDAGFISGQVLAVDGGWLAANGQRNLV